MEEIYGQPSAGSSYSNGYHHHQQPASGSNHRFRKPGRISRAQRDHRDGSGDGTRVCFQQQQERENQPPCTDFDKAYFQSYSHVGIHEEMIKDCVSTETYRTAILQHQDYIKDKVVVHVGCGTGILSIFCAQAGAKLVYAVDASEIALQSRLSKAQVKSSDRVAGGGGTKASGITPQRREGGGDTKSADIIPQWLERQRSVDRVCDRFCQGRQKFKCGICNTLVPHRKIGKNLSAYKEANEVVKANNLSETVIVLHGHVEDVEIEEEVDVIISEWMGYMLLYESMLGNVITARDRWLKPGGLILPSSAMLYMAPVTHPDRYSESIDFWRNVYGIDMSAMLPLAKQCAFEEPSVETINGENVLTWPHVVKHVDCYTITNQELESVTTRFKFQSMMRGQIPFPPSLPHSLTRDVDLLLRSSRCGTRSTY